MLINTAGGDGNLLLNVGPRPDGLIDPEQADVLKASGAWLAKYGESIYGTRGGPFKPGEWGVSTRKDNRIYLHVFKFDGDTLDLPAIPAKVTAARVLSGGSVGFKQSDESLTLTVPAANHDAIDTLISLDLDKPAMEIEPLTVRNPGLRGIAATAASAGLEAFVHPPVNFNPGLEYGAAMRNYQGIPGIARGGPCFPRIQRLSREKNERLSMPE